MVSRKPLKATGWFSPYDEKGRANLKSTGKGVYLIKMDGKIVYVGKGNTDVKKTLYRHFQTWTDRRQDYNKRTSIYERVTYKGYDLSRFKLKVIFTPTTGDTDKLEQIMINKIHPRDNTQKLQYYSQSDFKGMEKKLEKMEYASNNEGIEDF